MNPMNLSLLRLLPMDPMNPSLRRLLPMNPINPSLRSRHVDSFWFAQCARHTADTSAVASALNLLVGAPETAPRPLNVLLRSGLFFAPQIKAAAAAIRARIGGS